MLVAFIVVAVVAYGLGRASGKRSVAKSFKDFLNR